LKSLWKFLSWWSAEKKASQFRHTVWVANLEIVLLEDGDTKTRQASGRWHKRREEVSVDVRAFCRTQSWT
jgi:uncharacterized protein YecE (DUF72 family)